MPTLKPDDLSEITPELVGDLNRETLEKLALQVVDLALHLANRLNMNSANSSCPPSSDDPYRRQADRENPIIPREWFLVPLFVIDDAVEKIKDGTITGYVYDPKTAGLVKHSAPLLPGGSA
jgi:hypothetical protein